MARAMTSCTPRARRYRSQPKRLAAASGVLFALVNGGFAVGIALGGLLPKGLRWSYGAAALSAALATLASFAALGESLPRESRVPFKITSFNPLACARLFRSGREMRLLASLIALTLPPLFMGQFFQVGATRLLLRRGAM